jgi:hypothetical protein
MSSLQSSVCWEESSAHLCGNLLVIIGTVHSPAIVTAATLRLPLGPECLELGSCRLDRGRERFHLVDDVPERALGIGYQGIDFQISTAYGVRYFGVRGRGGGHPASVARSREAVRSGSEPIPMGS